MLGVWSLGWVFSPGACVFCPGGFSFEIGDGNKQLTLLCHTTLLCAFPPRCPREARCGRLVSRSSIFYIFFNSSPAIYTDPSFSLSFDLLYIYLLFLYFTRFHSRLVVYARLSLLLLRWLVSGFRLRFPAPVSGDRRLLTSPSRRPRRRPWR